MLFRVATYNVKNTEGGRSLSGIADELARSGADIIGLQELDRGTERSGRADLLAELGKKSGYAEGRFCRAIDFQGGEYGTGILTRRKILNASVRSLPSGEEARILTMFEIDLDGEKLFFANTHLSLEQEARRKQLAIVARTLRGRSRAVLTGDFNIRGFEELEVFCGMNIANFIGHSFDTFKTGGKIDNIITSPDISIRSVRMSESGYSDHNMLIADLEF
ncbi:MAG: endonuclease/exonuclease/phosphatase family protein [Clostridia bacterium]|nr:endonuclease/exonuclease/phosphatase family protein [Clostridia bacterium]